MSCTSATKSASEQIGVWEGGDYVVTAAIWRGHLGATELTSYEIGIRRKEDAKFWLLQSRKYDHQTVQEVANAIAHLLSIETENYDPEWCQEFFTGE